MAEFNGKQGVWRTVGGRRIFIVNGQDLPTAMKLSGKFEKEYTKKDIKKITDNHGMIGYELNGAYLLKSYFGYIGSSDYSWIINSKEKTLYDSMTRRKKLDNGELIIVSSYKEGIDKLIEIANNKKYQ